MQLWWERERERESFAKFFEEIRKSSYDLIKSNKGKDFEEQLMNLMSRTKFTKITNINKKSIIDEIERYENSNTCFDKWIQLKKEIKEKNNLEIIKNPFKNVRLHFIHQPYGSQDFPDFLFFVGDHVFALEIKFSRNSSFPVWNSNLPKSNALYIYGVNTSKRSELIFFKGNDFLGDETREILNDFFENLKKDEAWLVKQLEEKLKTKGLLNKSDENFSGLSPYIRKAFHPKEVFKTSKEKTDIFEQNKKAKWEEKLINFIRGNNDEIR